MSDIWVKQPHTPLLMSHTSQISHDECREGRHSSPCSHSHETKIQTPLNILSSWLHLFMRVCNTLHAPTPTGFDSRSVGCRNIAHPRLLFIAFIHTGPTGLRTAGPIHLVSPSSHHLYMQTFSHDLILFTTLSGTTLT